MQPAAEGADSSAARRAARRAAQGDARRRKQARLERKADKTLQKVQARHHPASDSDDECGGVEPAGEAYITLRFVLYRNVASMNLLDQATSHSRWSHLGAA